MYIEVGGEGPSRSARAPEVTTYPWAAGFCFHPHDEDRQSGHRYRRASAARGAAENQRLHSRFEYVPANFPANFPAINTSILVTASGRLCEFIDTYVLEIVAVSSPLLLQAPVSTTAGDKAAGDVLLCLARCFPQSIRALAWYVSLSFLNVPSKR